MIKKIAVIGAGGYCHVLIDIIKLNNYDIIGIYDDNKTGLFYGYKILGKIDDIDLNIQNFVISIGSDKVRESI